METLEQLRESLQEATRLKEQAEWYRKESELLLGSMQTVLMADTPQEMFAQVFGVFQQLLECNHCFVLEAQKPGTLYCSACSDGVFSDSRWQVGGLFKRILQGKTLSTFRVAQIPEWESQPESLRIDVGSALYSPVELQDQTAILVLTSPDVGAFSKNDEQLVARFSALVAQTMANVSAKLLVTENQKLRAAKEKAESDLLHAEKMASIGQLAAGVAHEINNPMGFIFSNSTMLKTYIGDLSKLLSALNDWVSADSEPTPEQLMQCYGQLCALWEELDVDFLREDMQGLLDDNQAGLERIRDIVLALRSFSRQDEGTWEAYNLNEGLELTLKMVMNELKYKVEIRKDLKTIPKIYCQPGRLNQVWMNMLVNAGQAIERHGTITIATEPAEQGVIVTITDTGCGISKEDQARLFEPFFTTKGVGEGTGLGLSISYSIIEQHGGRIEVDSRVNEGTRFSIYLPVEPPEFEADQV